MITSPATFYELAEAAGVLSPVAWAGIRGQMLDGDSWAVRGPDGELLAVGGLYMGTGKPEAWFLATPAARRQMLCVVRAIRLTLAAHTYDHITVTTRTRAGARIAQLAGFSRLGGDGQRETWVR